MSIIVRYQNILKGALSITGNTLGLAGDQFGNGVLNFTTASPPPPSGGMTKLWQNNSSSAFLRLPAGAQVKYAELTWAAMYDSSISLDLDTPITFTTPLGSNAISPDPTTSQSVTTQVGETFYIRTQNVTTIVNSAGAGAYTVGGVPGIITGENDYIGWCLIVAYHLSSLPFREIVIWSLFEHVQGTFGNVSVPITGFMTPSSGSISGRLAVCAGGGNPQLTGDFMQFGPTVSSLATLSGPNNLATNFFASQINDNTGNLDTSGTWGNMNSIPPNNAVTGDRNSFDITNVDVSAGLTNSQTNAIVIFGTTDDTYDALALGIQIDINSADITPVKTVDKAITIPGDTLSYSMILSNNGLLNADNVVVVDTLPNGTSFVNGSLTVNGITVPGSVLSPGYSIGTITFNTTTTLTFKAVVSSTPPASPVGLNNEYETHYTFSTLTTPQSANESSNIVTTTVSAADLKNATKDVDKKFADVGDYLTYTIIIPNTGDKEATNVIFSDTIPFGTTFVQHSVILNNATLPTANPNYGINIGTIPAGSTTTLTFTVQVTTLPTINPILNQGNTFFYSYGVTPSFNKTNTISTQVNHSNLDNTTKHVDKLFVTCGDIITYTINIPNTGNVTASNVVFTDTIPNGTVFVPNSLYINGIQQTGISPNTGVTIPNIPPGATSTINFSVKVKC